MKIVMNLEIHIRFMIVLCCECFSCHQTYFTGLFLLFLFPDYLIFSLFIWMPIVLWQLFSTMKILLMAIFVLFRGRSCDDNVITVPSQSQQRRPTWRVIHGSSTSRTWKFDIPNMQIRHPELVHNGWELCLKQTQSKHPYTILDIFWFIYPEPYCYAIKPVLSSNWSRKATSTYCW